MAQPHFLLFVDSGNEYPVELPRINIGHKSVTFHDHTKAEVGHDDGRDKVSDDETGNVAQKPQNVESDAIKNQKLENPKVSKYCFRLSKVPALNLHICTMNSSLVTTSSSRHVLPLNKSIMEYASVCAFKREKYDILKHFLLRIQQSMLLYLVAAHRPSVYCRGIQRAEETTPVAIPLHGIHDVQLISSGEVPRPEHPPPSTLRQNHRKSVSLPNLTASHQSTNTKTTEPLRLPNIFYSNENYSVVIPKVGPFFAKIYEKNIRPTLVLPADHQRTT